MLNIYEYTRRSEDSAREGRSSDECCEAHFQRLRYMIELKNMNKKVKWPAQKLQSTSGDEELAPLASQL